MLGSAERQIGEHLYTVRHLPATKAHKLLVRIGKVIGPAIGEGLSGKEAATNALGQAIAELFDRASAEELDAILKEFAEFSEVDGKSLKMVFDLHFAGKMLDLYKWFGFALEANYSDFFGVFKSLGASAQAVVSRLTFQSTSGGPSGG